MRHVTSEETFMVTPVHGAFHSVQAGPKVRKEVMATTMVKSLSDSSSSEWEIVGVVPLHGHVQEEEEEGQQIARTQISVVCSHTENQGLCWSSTLLDRALHEIWDVSITNNLRELCDSCLKRCESLRRVSRWSLRHRLSGLVFPGFLDSEVEDASIPDCFRPR